MGAKLSSGTSANGVIAYQDHAQPDQFHYWPARTDLVFEDTLLEFEVTHWGVNPRPYYVDLGGGIYTSSVGGILAGRARLDISDEQRRSIIEAIRRDFGINNPRLLPMMLLEPKVQPVIAQNIIELTENGHVVFPAIIGPGSTFSFLVSALNSLFAHLVASYTEIPVARPSFAVNVDGQVEFVGDPWTAEIQCDLSQVWSYTRTRVSTSVKWGWFTLGRGEYERIVQEMIRNGTIRIRFVEGSGTEGRQIFEVAKVLFESINKMAIAGEGFFRFDPNPTPQGRIDNRLLFGWWPWSVSVNMSYYHHTFHQSIHFNEVMSYTGRIKVPMGLSMSLAVGCSGETAQYFHDLQDTSNGCVTQAKSDGLQARIAREVAAKQAKTREYLQKLEDGEWTVEHWRQMMAVLREITLTESLFRSDRGGLYELETKRVIKWLDDIAQDEIDRIRLTAKRSARYQYQDDNERIADREGEN